MTPTTAPATGATYRSRRHPETVVTVTAVDTDATARGKGGVIIRGEISFVRISDGKPGTLSLPMFSRAYEDA